MKSLADFLQKFKAIRDPSLDKQIIVSLIKKYCSVDIDIASVQIKGVNIIISAHPAIKSVVYMKKAPLLAALSTEFPDKKFTDVL